MVVGREIDPRELRETLKDLEGLTRAEIAELVSKGIAPEDVASFQELTETLSDEGLRFLSARALVRLRAR
jgi:hypothetical protein